MNFCEIQKHRTQQIIIGKVLGLSGGTGWKAGVTNRNTRESRKSFIESWCNWRSTRKNGETLEKGEN